MAFDPREYLHNLVWSKPVSTAAKELGISDVALAKRCKREGISRPPRGYWAKVAAGQTPIVPPLPPPPVKDARPKAPKKVEPIVEAPEPPPALKRTVRRYKSRLGPADRTEMFWCKIDKWRRSYSFGVNWRPWEFNDESWSEHDRLEIDTTIRSKTDRPYPHIIVWLLPTHLPRHEFNRDLRAIGRVWTDRGKKQTLLCSAFIPADAYRSLCSPVVRAEFVELHIEVVNLIRGHGSTSSVSFDSEFTDFSDDE